MKNSIESTFLTIEEALKNHNSPANQSIKERLVRREIYACQSSFVGHLHGIEPDGFDVENQYYYNVDLSTGNEEFSEDEKDAKLEELRELLEEHEGNEPDEEEKTWDAKRSQLKEDIYLLENADTDFRDIYEYWLCSDWFLDKLSGQGECIVKHTETGEKWWGRCTTGQSISLDYVIGKIAANMKILEGQKNSWAKE